MILEHIIIMVVIIIDIRQEQVMVISFPYIFTVNIFYGGTV
jgi:hypothetical protein